MKRLHELLFIFSSGLALLFVPAPGRAVAVLQLPSLDLLAERVDSYWALLSQNKKNQAAEYVLPEDRIRFQSRTVPAFREPRLKSLELSADRTEARVTVTVKREFPTGIMDWTVTEKWVFDSGNWYVHYTPPSMPLKTALERTQERIDGERIEQLKRELSGSLKLEKSVLDFGTIKQGTEVSFRIKYKITGNEPLRVRPQLLTPNLRIKGWEEGLLTPGSEEELTLEVVTSTAEGPLNERLLLMAGRADVEVPFEIVVKGEIYVPVSLSPRILRIRSAKEQQQEITVYNHSKETLILQSFFSETRALTLEPMPARIPPGGRIQIQVKQIQPVAKRDLYDNLFIEFAQPVEGQKGLALTVVLNASEKKTPETYDPSKDPQVQEWIRRHRINAPVR